MIILLLSTDENINQTIHIVKHHSNCYFEMDNVLCKVCGKFVSKANYARHHKSHFEEVKFACYQCAKSFKRKDKLEDHLKTHRKPEEMTIIHSQSALKTILNLGTRLIDCGKM